MKTIILAGGSGFLGTCVSTHFLNTEFELIILTRSPKKDHDNVRYKKWDGKNQGEWSHSLENAYAVINFNGKSVDCRYTEKNKKLIYSTRLDATAALGTAIQNCSSPPKLWINAASSTIYRHSLDKGMDEIDGEIGTCFSIDVCQKWEKTFNDYVTPSTRKVLLRTAIVLGKHGGALQPIKALAKLGMGGKQGSGNQFVSWIHERDFVGIIDFILNHPEAQGIYNATSPHPILNRELMKSLRKATGIPLGLPMPECVLKLGALVIGTEPELVLKSRRVIPRRMLEAGYKFQFISIDSALQDLLV